MSDTDQLMDHFNLKQEERAALGKEAEHVEVRAPVVPQGEPRLIALLSWYDEPDAVLGQCLAGLQYAGVDHVVAVDGRYELFPGEDHVSSPQQQGLIALACRTLGMGCSLHMPTMPWPGEVEKRNFLFDQGLAVADPGDWFFVVDADIVVTCVPTDLKQRLAATDVDVACTKVRDMSAAAANRPDWPEYFDIRPLFRAQPLKTIVNHHTYTTLDGRALWRAAGEESGETEPALDLREFVELQHRPGSRGQDRQLKQAAYYGSREEAGIERHWCKWCFEKGEEVRAVARVPVRWRKTSAGIISDIAELCTLCKEDAETSNRRRMRRFGILCACKRAHVDPNGLCRSCQKPVRAETAYRVIERNGRPQIGVKPG
jgi:hypothetical protein